MAGRRDEAERDEVIDLDRAGGPGQPPVPGAQWDELHRRWERWDDARQRWVIVGDGPERAVEPPSHGPVRGFLLREMERAAAADAGPTVIDIDRLAAPARPVAGAQWNEVTGRWERWDEVAGAWVEVVDADAR